MADCINCQLEHRVSVLETALKEEQMHSSNARKDIYNKLESHNTQIAVTDERYRQILAKLSDLKSTVDSLAEDPANQWKSLKTAAIAAVCSGVAGYVISAITR